MSFLHNLVTRFDIIRIISDHCLTFRDSISRKWHIEAIVVCLILPIVFAAVCMVYFPDISKLTEILTNVYSIFCGLLFSIMVLMRSEFKEAVTSSVPSTARLIKETYSNISFAIVISLFGLLSLALNAINICSLACITKTQYFCSAKSWDLRVFLVVFLFTLFVLNMFIVIKRVYKICKP
jgi:hypothetical protein